MLNSVMVESLNDLLLSIRSHGGYTLNVWFSGDLRKVVMFHVSAYNLGEYCKNRYTEVLYTENMLLDMWKPGTRARRSLVTTNVFECPVEVAPKALSGDRWCNYRGGASVIQCTPNEWAVMRGNVKWLFFGEKPEALEWLREHDYVRFDRQYISTFYNKLIGCKFYPNSRMLNRRLVDREELIKMFNQFISYDKSKETDMFLDALFLLKNSDSILWKSPIYVSEDFKSILLFEYGNFIQPCRCSDMEDDRIYIHVFDIRTRKVTESYEYNEAIIKKYNVLQECSWPMLLLALNGKRKVVHTEGKLYRDAFYSCKWRFMYNEINTQVDE